MVLNKFQSTSSLIRERNVGKVFFLTTRIKFQSTSSLIRERNKLFYHLCETF
ncbi:hypothetical protein LEP1GSC008_1541 [Leptospira kirschneri serovar Bulgarica str. Nikolaevo]|uniref:Uncharacterized protein n=1 Tax=Leptospira kirschneri serovar Bulgarica str. Nikolaevo TaxID=1240687 RepID=M6FHP1_9LEPT|nr:hypothetical protein LEP1GSC008_1541 [Leptospira kirschneri serovar Bulgarica str. Nikolaevo]